VDTGGSSFALLEDQAYASLHMGLAGKGQEKAYQTRR